MSNRPACPKTPERLGVDFYQQDTEKLARQLLGKRLVRIVNGQRLTGIINETEAYLGAADKACHTYGGKRTPRVESMYLGGGHVYVYLIYGLYHCLNVVAAKAGEAVLIRSVKVEDGEAYIRRNRPKIKAHQMLSNGPGKLCMAYEVDRAFDGIQLVKHTQLWLEPGFEITDSQVQIRPRIGIDYAEEWAKKPLRYSY